MLNNGRRVSSTHKAPRLTNVDLSTTRTRRNINIGVVVTLLFVGLFCLLNYGMTYLRFLTVEMRSEAYRANKVQLDSSRQLFEIEQAQNAAVDSGVVREIATSQGFMPITDDNKKIYSVTDLAALKQRYEATKSSAKPYQSIIETIVDNVEISPVRKTLLSFVGVGKAFAAASEIENERKQNMSKTADTAEIDELPNTAN